MHSNLFSVLKYLVNWRHYFFIDSPSCTSHISTFHGQEKFLLLQCQLTNFLMRSDDVLLLHHAVYAVALEGTLKLYCHMKVIIRQTAATVQT